MHAARVRSLGNAVAGLVHAAVLAIHAVGHAYAQLAGIHGKSGITQIDRLLSNQKLVLDDVQRQWVEFIVQGRSDIMLAMDWTEFEKDKFSTLAVCATNNHGRATPLAWRTYPKSELKDNMRRFECEMVERLKNWLAPSARVTLLADRGFGDRKLYEFLMRVGWDFVIRFKSNIYVSDSLGTKKPAGEWLPPSGNATMIKKARVTEKNFEVPAVVVVRHSKMKEMWCLATSFADHPASDVVRRYGKRFSIEETFRDQKDIHFGMGLKATHIRSAARRDRIMLLAAIAHSLLVLLGAAAERTGLDRTMKANTVKHRTHSLYRQGLYWYGAIPNAPPKYLEPLMIAFDQIIREHRDLTNILGIL